MKTCSRCGESKPRNEFYKDRLARDGLRSCCGRCDRAVHDRYRTSPRGVATTLLYNRSPAMRHANRRSKYGLTPEAFDALYVAQGGLCGIRHCGEPLTEIDHDHSKTKGTAGFVRGLLCRPCNFGLGNFRDDPELLRAAADYLEKKFLTPPLECETLPV